MRQQVNIGKMEGVEKCVINYYQKTNFSMRWAVAIRC